jgi:ankyrin repeat protein
MRSGRVIEAALITLLSLSPCLGAPIHDAARQGDLETITKLIDQGVALEDRDGAGETPLLAASLAGRPELVVVLIKRGADVGARNDRGLTPLHGAAYAGSLETVRLLVDSGAAVNDAQNVFKVTPLIVAAEEGHADVVSFLADHGADLEWMERAGYTALSRATFRDHPEAINALLKAGAKCQSKDRIGPLASASCEKWSAALTPQ